MKKLITWISLILAVSLFAEPGENKGQLKKSMKAVPLSSIYLSTENGGTNHASAALSDGIGIYTTQEDEYARAIAYLNGKYGDDALKNEKSLRDYVLDTGTLADKELANKLNLATAQKSNIEDSCNDGNSQTENDIYQDENFTCKGVLKRSESKCFGDPIGSEFLVNGVLHLVVNDDTIRDHLDRAETLCTSNVTNMSSLFNSNPSFNQPIGNWDVSNVTDMADMFGGVESFNQPIGSWDVSNVTDMSWMFSGATSFNQDIGGWDVGKVTMINGMFYGASSFNQDISKWNTSNVTNMYKMFQEALSFNQDIGGWDVGKVEIMGEMFEGAKSFNQDISSWCVSKISSKPSGFDWGTTNWNKINRQPVWGTCP